MSDEVVDGELLKSFELSRQKYKNRKEQVGGPDPPCHAYAVGMLESGRWVVADVPRCMGVAPCGDWVRYRGRMGLDTSLRS